MNQYDLRMEYYGGVQNQIIDNFQLGSPTAKKSKPYPVPNLGNAKLIKKEKEMFSLYKQLKDYIANHKEVIFTILAVLIADKYLLNGALKERTQKLIEALLAKAEALVAPKEVAK